MSTQVILCVDDEPDVLEALQRVFIDEPYRIVTATSGARGLELLEQSPARVIIADYRMPGMNGADFLKQAHAMNPECINIMLTGVAEAATVLDLIESRVIYTFLAKPWNDDELRLAVRRGLEYLEIRQDVIRLTAALDRLNRELAALKAQDKQAEPSGKNKDLTDAEG